MGSWDKLGYIAFKMAATKSSEYADPEDARQVGLSWHEKRREVREKSTKGKYFRSPLQCLDNNEILLLLESILQRSKPGTQTANCTVGGLRAVQEHLMYGYGYLHWLEAYNLYSSFSEFSCPNNKQAFRDKLLDPHHGLPVYKELSARLFGLIMKEKWFFCFNYDMF